MLYEEANRLPLSPQEVYIPSDAFTVAYEENQSLLGIVFDIASRINRKQTPEIKVFIALYLSFSLGSFFYHVYPLADQNSIDPSFCIVIRVLECGL